MKIIFSLLLLGTMACKPADLDLSLPVNYAEDLISSGAQEQRVHIEIEPPSMPTQVFYQVKARDLAMGLTLRPTNRLGGWAKGGKKYLERDQQKDSHDSQARFSDIVALSPAHRNPLSTPRVQPLSTHLASDQSFSIDLLAGVAYVLVLNPGGLYGRAPVYFKWDEKSLEPPLAFNLDEYGQFVSGQIKYSGTQKDLWQVRITQANRLVSSVAQVKRNGHFLVELSKETFLGNDVPLLLTIEPKDAESTLPRFNKELSLDELLTRPNLGPIDLGRLPKALLLNIHIAGPGTIYLKGRVGMGEVSLKKALNIVSPTVFEGLYEGTYEIAIVPPAMSPWAMQVTKNIDITSPSMDMRLKWTPRQLAVMHVFDEMAKPMAGAQIALSRIGVRGSNEREDIFSDRLFSFTATTNDAGQACQRQGGLSNGKHNDCTSIALDDGRYVAHVIPPAGSHYAHLWQTFDFPEEQNLEFKLLETKILKGRLLSADSKSPLQQAYVTIYAVDSSLLNEPKILANAITDAFGYFRAFIPTSQKSY